MAPSRPPCSRFVGAVARRTMCGAAGLLILASSLQAQSAPAGTVPNPVVADTLAVPAAREPAPTQAFWIQGGFGVGSENWGLAAAASYQHRRHVVTARVVQSWEQALEGGLTVYDFGLLYGQALSTGHLHLSAGAGIAYTDCQGFADCNGDPFRERENLASLVGLPIEVQLGWRPLRFAGIGLYGFANLNQLQHFAGAVVTLQLGYMR